MTTLLDDNRVSRLRALEALRNGVPNGDAVRALGCAQPAVVDRFRRQLDELRQDPPHPVTGHLVRGDFGTGKSHLLEYLEQEALGQGFVCSRVVISKETPLYDPVKVVAAAIREARFAGGRGSIIHELAQRLDYRNHAASSLIDWANQAPGLLAATVHLHDRSNDRELEERILDFWSGDRIGVAEIRKGLRQIGSAGAFDVKSIRLRELAPLRMEFAARLARAAGFKGWVVLIDEIELVARYTLAQRAKSYAELARWMGTASDAIPGVTVVGTITDDFDLAVLQGKQDLVLVPERLHTKGGDDNLMLAARAEQGMRLIERQSDALVMPTSETLRATYGKVQGLYRSAYGSASDLEVGEVGVKDSIRKFIKRWIYEWDLRRYHPGAAIDITSETLAQDYSEDATLEIAAESDEE